MAGLGDLVTTLVAKNKMGAGLSSGQSSLKSFASTAKSAILPITAGFAAAAGGVYLLTSRIGKLAGIADKAVQTGLSGEFLQRLEYAADQSGVSVETLTGAIKKLTIGIGANKKGFEDLQGLSPEAAFLKVAEKISKIPTAAGRAAEAVKIFGKSGIEMTGLFAGGLDDVNKLLKEAKDLGIGVSEEDLKRAAAADDALQRMKASIGALVDKATVSLAPAVTAIADGITGWIKPLNLFMDDWNALPNKFEWAGQTLSAAFDVGFETIKMNWSVMLEDMMKSAIDFAKGAADIFANPAMFAVGVGAQMGAGAPDKAAGLNAAQDRLAGLMGQLNRAPAPGEKPFQFVGPQQGFEGVLQNMREGGKGDLKGLIGDIGNALEGPLAGLKMKGQGMLDRAKMDLNWLGGVASNAITGQGTDSAAMAQKKMQPQTASAMKSGSSEAFSTIIQAMLGNKNDPNVKATEKQTKDLVEAWKGNKWDVKKLEAFPA